MSTPVTVSVTRHIDPGHTAEMIAWVRAGASLAERFDGFLGVGWMRPSEDSDEWHMLYRFASDEHLAQWEASAQRAWWLAASQGRIGESRLERRTGIEGWFDEPTSTDVQDLRATAAAPPRWKQMIMIWLAFFPLSLLVALAFGQWWPEVPVVERVLLSTVMMTPLMVFVVLPRLTRWLDWWLHGRPAPWARSA